MRILWRTSDAHLPSTIGGLTCGASLCDECEHELDGNGTTGFHFRHCKKVDQKYTPWYERGPDDNGLRCQHG